MWTRPKAANVAGDHVSTSRVRRCVSGDMDTCAERQSEVSPWCGPRPDAGMWTHRVATIAEAQIAYPTRVHMPKTHVSTSRLRGEFRSMWTHRPRPTATTSF